MALIDVVIQISGGEAYFPPQVPAIAAYGKKYPYSRIGSVSEIIKEEGCKNKFLLSSITVNSLKEIEDGKIFSLYDDEGYYYTRNLKLTGEEALKLGQMAIYRIVKVNTSIPWTIKRYPDGIEHVKVLTPNDSYKVLDKELFYCEEVE